MYISVSRNKILSFNISYSNLIERCFVSNSFKKSSRFVLLPVHTKNIVYKHDVYNWKCLDKLIYEFSYEAVHQDVCLWGCADFSYGAAFYLLVVFVFENRVA